MECHGNNMYHSDGRFLNSGRNALRHILRTYKISRIYVPHYTCPVVLDAVRQECSEVLFYTVTSDLRPIGHFPKVAAILYTNYFGVCGKIVDELAASYPNLIVDNAQSFYSAPSGLGAFYSPRKFFGLPDGGIAVCRKDNGEVYPDDTESHNRASHLLIRHDLGAEAGYPCFTDNDAALDDKEIMNMSALTYKMMGNIDYEGVKKQRLRNFYFLAKHLNPEKNWDLRRGDVPMVYPYFTDDPDLRKRLVADKIFVATYWKGTEGYAQQLTDSLIPLPLDQRYNIDDMKLIVEKILGHEITVTEEDYAFIEEEIVEKSDETTQVGDCLDDSAASTEESSAMESVEFVTTEEEVEIDASEQEEQSPEDKRDLLLRRFRQIRILPSRNSFKKMDAMTFVENHRNMMPVLREDLSWLKEQQKFHEDKKYILTVLLVTYNHFRSIATALESILQQKTTYPYIIKILDDCSNDGTSKVCIEYARLYPDKIVYCPEVLNTSAINITAAIRQVKTPYYTLIDGDDRWCCEDKIQRSIDFLESHPEYSAFTHDTLFYNRKKKSAQSYTHQILKVEESKDTLTFDDYFYTHMTARVHRNNIDWIKEYPNVRLRDIYLFYLSLDRGPFYYCDEIMSEYVFSGQGSWSKQSFIEVQYSYNFRRYMVNVYTKFRHEKVLRENTKSRLLNLLICVFRKRLGWWIYTNYRKYRLLWDSLKALKGKLDFVEYKHRSYPHWEQVVRDEVWNDRF